MSAQGDDGRESGGVTADRGGGGGAVSEEGDDGRESVGVTADRGGWGGGGVRGGGRWQRKWRSDSRSWRGVSEEGDDGREGGGVTADRGGGCQRRGTIAEKVQE